MLRVSPITAVRLERLGIDPSEFVSNNKVVKHGLTRKEVMAFLGMTNAAFVRHKEKGALPPYIMLEGRERYRFPLRGFVEWLEDRRGGIAA